MSSPHGSAPSPPRLLLRLKVLLVLGSEDTLPPREAMVSGMQLPLGGKLFLGLSQLLCGEPCVPLARPLLGSFLRGERFAGGPVCASPCADCCCARAS